jgi:hypothetical protein
MLSAASACTSQPKEDPRIAQLQKELAEVKQQQAAAQAQPAQAAPAAANPQPAPPAPSAQAAPSSANPQVSTAATNAANADRAATQQALSDHDKALSEQKKGLEEQRAATARQAGETARLRTDVDSMKPREFTLPQGTVIPVRTTAQLSTKTVKNGSVFEALLENDLVVDGATIAKKGTHATCIVVSSDPGGRIKGVASLEVALRSIAGVRGNTLNVKTESYEVEAGTTKGKDATRTGIAAAAGAAIGAIAGGGKGAAIGLGAGAAAGVGANAATRGAAAVIPTETLIEFKLSAPATVVLRP